MTLHAEGELAIDSRQGSPVEWEGAKMSRARWTKKFTGDLTATSYIEFVMGELDEGDSPRVYVGVERVEGTLHGRKGAFVLVHSARSLGAENEMVITVLPGSGTGELSGITGTARITPEHAFILDYELGS
jgi:Protein of unknown function (DUF3224)